jgi:hypothetical protein
MALQHLRSSTASKRPLPASMSDGQLAINTNSTSPGLFYKDSAGALVKVGPVHVGTTAPNASPASGGETGNSVGELWLDTSASPNQLKTWNGSAWVSDFPDEIPVSKLADGTARQLLQTDAAGTGVEWTSNVDVPGTLDVTSTATFDSIISASAGAAATPSITFTGDTNTGIYSPGADQVAISTNSSQRLLIDASGRVGVGNASPGSYESTFSQLVVGSSGANGITIVSDTASNGNIAFADGTAGLDKYRGYIQYIHSTNALAFGTDGAERFRVDSSGRLGLGTSSPSATLEVGAVSGAVTAGDLIVSTGSTTASVTVGRLSSTNADNTTFNVRNRVGTSIFYVDTPNSRVGIGSTAPGSLLTLNAASNPSLRIDISNTRYASLTADTSSNATFLESYENYPLAFSVSSAGGRTERARIDTSGRLLVGTSSSYAVGRLVGNGNYPNQANQQIHGPSNSFAGLSLVTNRNSDETGSFIALGKSRGTTPGSVDVVVNGDDLGTICFVGADGTDLESVGAAIAARVDGTPGANDMPGRLVFSTTADGASSPTERLRILANGNTNFRNCTDVYPTTDNAVKLGADGYRWSAVWAANGTIQTSDQRAKADIADSQLGSDFIKALRPVSYKWIEGGKIDTGERDEQNNYIYESVPGTRTHWGFIAQEVKQAVDAAGVDFGGWVLTDKDDLDSQQALRYDQFIAPLTKALQEALAKIETLEAKVAALEGV